MATWARQAWAVTLKDLRIEVRGREVLNSIVPFAGTLLVVFGLAFGPGRAALQVAAPALLWLAVLFAGVLALGRSFEAETEDGALEGLVLAPAERSAIFAGKVLAVSVQLAVLEALTFLGTAFLFDLTPRDGLVVVAALLLGTLGLAGIGTLFGALASRAQARQALFPLLLLPLAAPVLLAGVRTTQLAVTGPTGEAGSWLGLLLAFAAISVSAGALGIEHLMED
ncbi:MAG: heme exporter protein CcmB [Acidimicrobiia bacterium]